MDASKDQVSLWLPTIVSFWKKSSTMNRRRSLALLWIGLGSGILSLPATWVTFRPARGGPYTFLPWFSSTLGDPTITVTGFAARTFFPFEAPLWVVVIFSIGASAIRLSQICCSTTAGLNAVKGVAVIGAIWLLLVFAMMFVGERESLGIGGFLAMMCAAISVVGACVDPDDSLAGTSTQWESAAGTRSFSEDSHPEASVP